MFHHWVFILQPVRRNKKILSFPVSRPTHGQNTWPKKFSGTLMAKYLFGRFYLLFSFAFHIFSVCLFSCNWFCTYIFFMRSNFNVISMDTLLQITQKNYLYTILRLFNLIKHLSIWLIPISLGKFFLENKFFFLENTGNGDIFLFRLTGFTGLFRFLSSSSQ